MKKSMFTIDRIRQCSTSRYAAILVLWITIVASIPHTEVNSNSFSQIQRILLPNLNPVATPGHVNKITPDDAEFFVVQNNTTDLDEHLQTYLIPGLCSSEYARILTSSLLYTQTTSSCL